MVNRLRLSSVLFFISFILLVYPTLFKIPHSLVTVSLSWTLLAMSRALIMFPSMGIKAEVNIGKEIKR
jgi:hypothetical protein